MGWSGEVTFPRSKKQAKEQVIKISARVTPDEGTARDKVLRQE